ncbi:MAG: hypothetical protein LBH58_00885 [Tannerellaceae bacterium]|jgi:hypothetical protein|nr:hypothetical protein [Tannerellaceae bacterium]
MDIRHEAVCKKVSEIVIERTPPGMKPVDYLMSLLDIGLDSAYRRLKGHIPYSIGELVKLSFQFKFSIDEITGKSHQGSFFLETPGHVLSHPRELYVSMFTYFVDLLEKFHKSKSTLFYVLNKLLIAQVVGQHTLCKFFYFKWVHQMDVSPVKFSTIDYPEEMAALSRKITHYLSDNTDFEYIVDSKMIENTMDDVLYYYRRNLITKEDLDLIKRDVSMFIDHFEKRAQTGLSHVGSKVNIYVSDLDIRENSVYISDGEKARSHFWINSSVPICSRELRITSLHMKMINSLKRHCVLITKSNEMFQAEYFDKQRSIVRNAL